MYRFLSSIVHAKPLLSVLLAGMLLVACEAEKAQDAGAEMDSPAPSEVGSWSLVSVEAPAEDGALQVDSNWEKGILMLDGRHYALQMVRPNRPTVAGAADLSAEDARTLLEGYRSSNGSYAPAAKEGHVTINQETGLFGVDPSEWQMVVDGNRLKTGQAGGVIMTWERLQSPTPMSSELVGMWRLVKAERRADASSDFVPAFPGATGFTTFDEYGNRLWDVSFAGRQPLSYEEALGGERAAEELRGMIQNYLVGIVRYEVEPANKVLTQVENDGIIPGAGFKDWTYGVNPQGQLEVTLANGLFRATYKPWTN